MKDAQSMEKSYKFNGLKYHEQSSLSKIIITDGKMVKEERD